MLGQVKKILPRVGGDTHLDLDLDLDLLLRLRDLDLDLEVFFPLRLRDLCVKQCAHCLMYNYIQRNILIKVSEV